VAGPVTETWEGEVRRELFGAGTKSERVVLVLVTPEGRWRLRRRGAPAYGEDVDLAALEGHRVSVTGSALGTVFLVDGWAVID
jgi:hypothetical protein